MAQSELRILLQPGEQWWGGAAQYGYKMPFNKHHEFALDLYGDKSYNQSAPLLLSNKGRWVWCDEPFMFSFRKDSLFVSTSSGKIIKSGKTGESLTTAYR